MEKKNGDLSRAREVQLSLIMALYIQGSVLKGHCSSPSQPSKGEFLDQVNSTLTPFILCSLKTPKMCINPNPNLNPLVYTQFQVF